MITGGSKGIGKELAKQFLKRKYDLILIARNENDLIKTKNELENQYKNQKIYIEAMDLTKEENFHRLVAKYPEVDILINNAGMVNLNYSYKIDIKTQLDGIKLNVEALYFLSNFYIKKMVENSNRKKFQGIINVSSISGLFPQPLTTYYSPTKYFVDQYTNNLRYEIKKEFQNINIMSLCPGAIDTGLIDETKFIKARELCFKLSFLNMFQKPEFVASKAVLDFYKNKKRSIPGKLYKILIFLLKCLPESLSLKIMYNMIGKELK